MLQIITDSASDITAQQAKNLNIHIAPIGIQFPDGPCPQESLPVLYENNETSPELYAFRYDPKSGALEIINAVNTYAPEENGSPSDLQIHPSGKYLYAAVRKLNKLVVLRTDDQTGAVTIIQEVDNPGAPRGMAVSPDGRFLLVANNDTACVCCYAIAEDGRLTLQEGTVSVPNAANIGILFFD